MFHRANIRLGKFDPFDGTNYTTFEENSPPVQHVLLMEAIGTPHLLGVLNEWKPTERFPMHTRRLENTHVAIAGYEIDAENL